MTTRRRRRIPGPATREALRCSFCNKSQFEVSKLVAGPGVYICNECVELCDQIIAEGLAHRSGPAEDGTTSTASSTSHEPHEPHEPPEPSEMPEPWEMPEPPEPSEMPEPPEIRAWKELSDESLLAEMVRAHAAHENVDRAVGRHVTELRARDVTWARIGEALGMTRQSAWERFSDEE